jgi:Fe-S-cluster containining protein
MDLLEKSLKVKEVFSELNVEIQQYLTQSQLGCFAGCGLCCANPKVSASVLEFLPLAFDLYHSQKAEETLSKLSEASEDSYCILLNKLSVNGDAGNCTSYQNRGLICRLFASSARKNKNGEKELLVCKKIKEGKSELFQATSEAIKSDLPVPVGADYYSRLYQIDFNMTTDHYPINLAITKAIEHVLRYYYYMPEENAV